MAENGADQIVNEAKASGSWPKFLRGFRNWRRDSAARRVSLCRCRLRGGIIISPGSLRGTEYSAGQSQETKVATSFRGALDGKQVRMPLHATGWFGFNGSRITLLQATGSYAKYTGPSVTFPGKHMMRSAAFSESCPSRRILENFSRRPKAAS
jgi:hypothetical protein